MEFHIKKHQFTNPEIDIIEMKNDEIEVHLTSLGCAVIAIYTNDAMGNKGNVILGFDDMDLYQTQDKYIGALVGRCAGRIKGASFSFANKTYQLAKNNGENTLHGGNEGFDKKLFTYEVLETGVCFHYRSIDGEEGFPGNLDVSITYSIDATKLIATYEATCDQDTIVNLTNHMYFNLKGEGSVLNHELQLHADEILCSDEDCCANKTHRCVKNTPFDFRESKPIGRDIDKADEQLAIGGGYDHYFIFNSAQPAVILKDPSSGRVMEISTNQTGCQMYTANFLDGSLKGRNDWYFNKREAVCFETQAAPNAIHIEKEPSTIVCKGNNYGATTIYEFKIEGGEKTNESK